MIMLESLVRRSLCTRAATTRAVAVASLPLSSSTHRHSLPITTPACLFSSSTLWHQGRGKGHFRPFTADDEVQLAAVLSSRPRHVARHIRQSMQQSRRRVTQFRNAVTYLMILLQSRLQKKEIAPAEAAALVESLMKECVELRQGDMAHLLFRAAIRFRKYGMEVGFSLVKLLYDSYRMDNAQELMRNMADEMRGDPALRLLAVLAYQFSGQYDQAMALLKEIPKSTLTVGNYCAIIEGFGMTARYTDIMRLTTEVLEDPQVCLSTVETGTLLSAAILAIRGDTTLMDQMVDMALQKRCTISDAALGAITRSALQRRQDIHSVVDVYAVEEELRTRLGLETLGMASETAIIGKCSEVINRGHELGDETMLEKVRHLDSVVEVAIENDQIDDLEPSYIMALIRGYGVLGRFDEMRGVFDKLKAAGGVRDHRIYDEMLKWYTHAHNLKEVIALKEEMSTENVFHTAQTYYYVFRVLDKYYPRMVEKYLNEMESKGMRLEGFMYPTLIRVFAELQDMTRVENFYRDAKARVTQGYQSSLSPMVIIQMLKCYQGDMERAKAIIADADSFGLLANEYVQAEVAHFYARNDRLDDLHGFIQRIPHKSASMYRVLLRDAATHKDRARFQALLQEVEEAGVATNERLFSVVITAFSHFNDAEGVRTYVSRAVQRNEVRTPLFFADAAAAYARLGDTEAVDQCWKDLLASKMVITMPVYNRFLDLYLSANNMTMMQEILDTMMKLVPPNPVTATTVVDMLGKMGRLTEMEAVLSEMSRSTNAAPTLVTFHQAMNAYAKVGDVAKMEAVRERLIDEGFQENHVTYNILFDGYGRSKRYEHLQDLIAERREKNIPMEEFGYVVLLNIYSRARMTEQTEALVEEMVSGGVAFSSRMLATVASSFSFIGDVPQMERYVSLLLAHPDCRLREVESVYIIYSRLRDTARLQALLDNPHLPRSEFIYNLCVSAFAKAGEHTKVAYLLTQMEAHKYTLSRNTSVTLSSLLLKAGKLELAQTVLKWKGLSPSEVDQEAAGAGGAGEEDEGEELEKAVGSDALDELLKKDAAVEVVEKDEDEDAEDHHDWGHAEVPASRRV